MVPVQAQYFCGTLLTAGLLHKALFIFLLNTISVEELMCFRQNRAWGWAKELCECLLQSDCFIYANEESVPYYFRAVFHSEHLMGSKLLDWHWKVEFLVPAGLRQSEQIIGFYLGVIQTLLGELGSRHKLGPCSLSIGKSKFLFSVSLQLLPLLLLCSASCPFPGPVFPGVPWNQPWGVSVY